MYKAIDIYISRFFFMRLKNKGKSINTNNLNDNANDIHYDLDHYYHWCIFQGLLIFTREMST